jgi:hypothetical protein
MLLAPPLARQRRQFINSRTDPQVAKNSLPIKAKGCRKYSMKTRSFEPPQAATELKH